MIGKIFKGVGKVFKAASGLMNALKGIMNSPLGGLLAKAFPPLGMAMGAMSFLGMFSSLSSGIGGGLNY